MTAGVRHLAWKDVRQHRAWLAAYLVIVAVRGLLVGSGIDAHIADQGTLVSMGFAYLVLCVLHVALLVTVVVQVVQGDRLVGTTAFWLTRPVSRRSLLVAKLVTVSIVLVIIPIVLDAFVLAVNRMAWLDVLGAVAEGALIRLAVVLPIMTLAAITSDLAVFVVAAVAAFFGTFALEVALLSTRLLPWRSPAAADSMLVVVAALLIAGSLAACAHQVFTRRTRRTVCVVLLAALVVLHAANRWDTVFVSARGGLEAGWLDPARISLRMTPLPADQVPAPADGRPWLVRAAYTITGHPQDVVVTPLGLESKTIFPDGTTDVYRVETRQRAWDLVPSLPMLLRKDRVEALLGGVRLLDASAPSEAEPIRPIALLTPGGYRTFTEHGARFDVNVTLGALAYKVGAVLPLGGHATGSVGGRRVEILSATCGAGKCRVLLRDVMAAFAVDLRRPSSVVYVLVNRHTHQALLMGERDDFSRYDVFGRATSLLLAEHVAVTRRQLEFEAPKDTPNPIDASWQAEASIAALEMRDIGRFAVAANVLRQDGK